MAEVKQLYHESMLQFHRYFAGTIAIIGKYSY